MNEPQGRWFSSYPAVWLAAAFAIGVLGNSIFGICDSVCKSPNALPGWSILLFAGLLIAAATQLPERYHISAIGLIIVSLFAGIVLSGFERNGVTDDRIRSIYDRGEIGQDEPVTITGTVDRGAEPAPDGVFLSLYLDSIEHKRKQRRASGVVRLFMPIATEEAASDLQALELRHGTQVRVSCRLVREDAYLNPGVRRRTELLDQKGIDATGSIKGPLMIEVIRPASGWNPLTFFYHLRQDAITRIGQTFSPQTAGIMIAAMLGDKYFLDRETADAFRRGGTFHILVISGLHMTFIGGLVLLLVRRLTSNRWAQLIVAGAVIWVYTLSVGAESPAVRASLMFTLLLLGRALFRSANLINTLGICVLILLAWRPGDILDPSFQLTVVSVTAIVTMAIPLISKLRSIGEWTPTANAPFPPNVSPWLKRACETLYWSDSIWSQKSDRNIWSANLIKQPLYLKGYSTLRVLIGWIFDGLLVSIVVQIWMLPLLIYYFHRVPLGSAVLNLFIGALVAAISLVGAVAILIAEVSSTISAPFVGMVELLARIAIMAPKIVSYGSENRIPIYADYTALYLIYLVPMIVLSGMLICWDPFDLKAGKRERVRQLMTGLCSVVLISIGSILYFHPNSSRVPDGILTIRFLDVGQGDAAFITFPNGETMLIDAGGKIRYDADGESDFEPDRLRVGEFVVSEFLWELGIDKVDHILASHADADHMQGLVDIAKNFRIGTAHFAAIQGASQDFEELEALLIARGISRSSLSDGDSLLIGGVRVDVLYPGHDEAALSENDRSLVLLLTFGEHRFLFTGDIEAEAERRILLSKPLVPIDIVKVAHHGSRTSSSKDLVSAVSAKIAVIPVGRRSQFGHPHPEVIRRWTNAGTNAFTTGELGTITITSDGKELSVDRFLK